MNLSLLRRGSPGKAVPLLIILLLVAIVGGLVFLTSWDPPAPADHVVKDMKIKDLTKK